jgi:hypothetical protein
MNVGPIFESCEVVFSNKLVCRYYSADPEAAKADTFNDARAVHMSPSLNSDQKKDYGQCGNFD